MYNLIGAGLIVIGAGIGLGQIGGKAILVEKQWKVLLVNLKRLEKSKQQ